jgi:isocitrate dehydrogenase kinase/phosphatase
MSETTPETTPSPTPPALARRQLAQPGADTIHLAFATYQQEFKRITRRAKARFEGRDWHGAHADALERLELYPRIIQQTVASIREALGEAIHDKALWVQMKRAYADRIAGRADIELAETFFNSVSRRIFTTVGVDPNIEFVDSDFAIPSLEADAPIYTAFPRQGTTGALIAAILRSCDFRSPYGNLERDAHLVAERIDAHLRPHGDARPLDAIEMLKPVFYRGKGAYLVGRLRRGSELTPLTLALLHTETGIHVDAVLLTAPEVSIVFSFTRSYFRVEADCPHDLIAFLKSILPQKRIAELYISIGYNKHGKTELYRALLDHLRRTDERFEPTYGDKGMVMAVFTLHSLNIVFKIIRDAFDYPKVTTRPEVMQKYQLVFTHDRAGRLVDAQEFEHLAFDRARFAPGLLDELQRVAANTVAVSGEQVIIRHLYTERRVTPLNLYLRQADEHSAREAVLDYGQAIKDLAATDIFPGDLLLKNFGVTRHGRVIFYDYDELCRVTDCNFRDLPRAQDLDEEMSGEPWFYVGDKDIFPEEFLRFLGFSGPLREVFLAAHGDLLTADFWRKMQARHRAGEIMDIFPYKQSRRLHRE